MKVELNRSAFEAFAQRNEFGTYRTDRKGDGYDSSHTQLMWMAWCAAIQQADAQQPATDEPVYWEWRHLGNNQFAADFGQWSEWKRVEARSPIFTAEDELRTLRRYIADGYKYELRALYTHPAQGVPDDVARDAERYRFIRDADVSDDLIPDIALYAMESLDEYIDAAMLAAHPAQKGD